MGQVADLVWGLMAVIGILAALGAAAVAFGTDSRPCIGDTHTTNRRGDWV